MATESVPEASGGLILDRLRDTAPYRHLLLPRILAGVPLFGIGLSHIFVPEAAMRPMIEAAGFPFPALVAPLGVAVQIVAGLSLLLGLWARIGRLLGVLFTLGAIYAHVVIDVWPGQMPSGPPDALPVIVLVSAAYVLWRGAGRWSLDRRATEPQPG
jgi:putative oxidoreductase